MKILVSRLKFIGDIVLTTPVIEVLKSKFPESEIDYLGDKEGVTLLENNSYLNEIIPYDFNRWEVAEQIRVGRALHTKRYDVAIDLFGNPRSAIAIFLSGAKIRIGGDFGWREKTFTYPIRINEKINAVDFHLRYLAPLSIYETYRRPQIYLTDAEKTSAAKYLGSIGIDNSKPVIGMHVGATWPAKVWPSESFARLAGLVQERLDTQIVVTYGPKDVEHMEAFAKSAHVKFAAVTPRKLRMLASVISQLDAFISNDAAPMHISAAVGTPTIGLFGPGDPDVWFPYERSLGHCALKKNVECCHKDYCTFKGEDYMRCMKQLKAEEVFEVIKTILNANGSTGKKRK